MDLSFQFDTTQAPARPASGERIVRAGRGSIRAKYDAAQTTDDNRRHWDLADSLSSVGANTPEIRRTLRDRSRYEIANNCYLRGITNTVAAYMVGSGPTLQLNYRGDDANEPDAMRALRQTAQRVERLYHQWAESRKIGPKLVTAVQSLLGDGEGFGLLISGRPTMRTPVWLDLRLYESDQFEDPTGRWFPADPEGAAGVRLDQYGEPEAYAMLRSHPGDANTVADLYGEWKSADSVLHWYRKDRPGQLRGIPWTTPALPLCALLRRFKLATITAAETAADFAAILYQDAPATDEEQLLAAVWERIEIERGAMLSAPDGSRLSQLKAEHPNSTFDEFERAVLREMARALSVPAVIALGDASNYNYASGRLDLQNFNRQMATDRANILECEILNPLFTAWLDEALLIDGFLPAEFAASAGDWSVSWRWSEPEHVDREKEASGQQIELANNTTTLAREYARKGLDWEVELKQKARELELLRELGLSASQAAAQSATDQLDGAEDEQEDEESSATAASV